MPVKFRGTSEYTAIYKWSPSYRSASFQPTREQSVHDAGMRSDEFYLLNEPGFTHKRQVIHRPSEAGDCFVWEASLNEAEIQAAADENTVPKDADNMKTYKIERPPIKKVAVREETANPKAATTAKKASPKKTKNNVVTVSTKKSSEKNRGSVGTKKQSKTVKIDDKHRAKSAPVRADKPVVEEKSVAEDNSHKHVPLRFRSRKLPSYHYPSCTSEYQRTYKKPKNIFRASPLISALDIVHQSRAIPSKSEPAFRFKTVYSTTYRVQEPLRKSMPASPASPSMKRKVKNMHSQSKSKKSPSRSPAKVRSEYEVRYPDRDFPVAEQTELLEAAEKNRANRDGENFDRTHAAQLHSPTNKYWDMSSSAATASTVTGDTVASSTQGDDVTPRGDVEVDSLNAEESTPVVVRQLSFGEVDSIEAPTSVRSAGTESTKLPSTCRSDITVASSSSATTVEGRVPTPDLKRIGGAQRTHHDITTPSKGGAILSSPTRRKKKFAVTSPLKSVENVVKHDEVLVRNEKQPAAEKKNFTELPRRIQRVVRAPIRGALRDEEFQHYGRNSRPLSALERISITSRRSSASVQNLLEKSLQRKDFWAAGN